MIIELIGTPGSGKTTIMQAVIEHFRGRGVDAYSRRDIHRVYRSRSPARRLVRWAPGHLQERIFLRLASFHRTLEWQKHLLTLAPLIRHVQETQQNRPVEAGVDARNILPSFRRSVESYGLLKTHRRPSDVLVFDEGFVHRVVALYVSPVEMPDPARVKTYLNLVPPADYVIHIQSPPEECMRRRIQRGLTGYLATLDEESLARFFAHAHATITLTVDHLRQKGWTVLEIDNSDGRSAQAAEELERMLEKIGGQALR